MNSNKFLVIKYQFINIMSTSKATIEAVIEAVIDSKGIYSSFLNGKLQSFPYYDEKTKTVRYHPAKCGPRRPTSFYKNGELHSYNDEPAINPNDDLYYYKEGKVHREGDKPAIIRENGDLEYLINGELHRDGDKPAISRANGDVEYYKNGKLHRDGDEPAKILSNGDKYYCKDGNLHREGGEPAKILANGDKEYYEHGVHHREGDEPAVIKKCGDVYYYKAGWLHREGDKPAVIKANGDVEYWLSGLQGVPPPKKEDVNKGNKNEEKNTVNETINPSPDLSKEAELEESIKYVLSRECIRLTDLEKANLILKFVKDTYVTPMAIIKFVRNNKSLDRYYKQHILTSMAKINTDDE